MVFHSINSFSGRALDSPVYIFKLYVRGYIIMHHVERLNNYMYGSVVVGVVFLRGSNTNIYQFIYSNKMTETNALHFNVYREQIFGRVQIRSLCHSYNFHMPSLYTV